MGEVLGQIFVKEYFPEKTKKRYVDLVEAMRVPPLVSILINWTG
jgi:predicted metalloendopeptidase